MTAALRIDVTYDQRVYFAMQQNSVPMVQLLRLTNTGEEELVDLDVTVTTVPELAAPWTRRVAAVPPGATYNLADVDLQLRADALVVVSERTHGSLRVTVSRAGEVIAASELPLDVLAYNEWPGAASLPAILAAFVLPNHPELAPVLVDASKRLQAATGNGALDGYQGRDPARVLAMAQALWEALAARHLVYVSPPPSFEQHGQKVRTPEQMLGERLGTCLDLAVLYAACCEAVGLHPLLVLLQEHALAGVWLLPAAAPEPAFGDALELQKRIELDAMAVVECTALCGDVPTPFARACERGVRQLRDKDFVFAVDVAAARTAGMRPLPLRSSGYAPLFDAGIAAPASIDDLPAAAEEVEAMPVMTPPAAPEDRLSAWKRRLLDLSLRNRLLHFRASRSTVALLAADLADWEDALATGRSFALLPRPQLGGASDPRDLERRQQQSGHDVVADYLRTELQRGRLHCDHDDDDLAARLTGIFRAARTGLEESGANTLYIAIGFLRWFEAPQSQQERLAPLLLLPLRLERLSMAEGFRAAMTDEDPQLNHTLLQKLERDFGLRLPALLPEDDAGVDVAAVLQQFRAAVVGIPRWQVVTAASIGFFSFTKHLMWLDLEERSASLRQNPLVQHLIETPEAAYAPDGSVPGEHELDDLEPQRLLCPKDADASQLRAVLAASAGRSFVLEGPPGTGKSQTITNLIAQALAEGKRVLFVAEKRAALEVVQRRLCEVGLGPFCLELHSHKGSKQAVTQQLAAALELGREPEPVDFAARAQELERLRQQLNRHVDAMHRPRRIGRSVYQVVGQLVAQRDDPYLPGLPIDVDEEVLQQQRQATAALQQSSLDLGIAPSQHRFHGSRLVDWHPLLLRQLPPLLPPLQQAVAGLAAALTALAADLDVDAEAVTRAQLPLWRELGGLLRQGPLPEALLLADDFAARQTLLLELCAVGRQRDGLHQDLMQRWRPELLRLDVGQLRLQFQLHGERFVLLRWWRLRQPKAQLRAVALLPLPDSAVLVRDLDATLSLLALQRRIDAAAEAAAWLGADWRDGACDWPQLEQLLQRCERARQLAALLAAGQQVPVAELRRRCAELSRASGTALPRFDAFALALHQFESALPPLAELLRLDHDAAFGMPTAPGAIATIAARTAGWIEQPAALREHTAFRRDADAADAQGLQPLTTALLASALPAATLQRAFERSFAEDWLSLLLQREPELARFRGLDHERCIQQFRRVDRELLGLAAKVVRARLSAQLPSLRTTSAESSELGILLREIKKQRRHLPVRQLFARIPNLMPRLAPCLLMSPLSVAQFLGASFPAADVVVFDEASQIPVWDAIGAIGRGRAAVVVGDSRQLPPTTFFQRQDGGDADEPLEDDVVEELESVLDECNAAGLERLHLRWHYRSRHESLIAFSNHHYYDNRLLTFPSPDAGRDQRGVQLRHVQGVYDRARSQQNLIEAEALVAEVLRRLGDDARSAQSLGIVTFSAAQQHLIEDLLDQQRRADPRLDAFFAAVDEPVFVKNLENVQGDERDVILFSIGYGPDAAGKVWVNFGPLNQRGGERRLNVAITRARSELLVFTSLRPEQIDLRRVQSLGARHLLTFLDYAARGPQAIAEAIALDPRRGVDSPFEAQVRDALVQRGYEVHEQIGCSGYRIDLGIVDPRAPGRYLLGVECDGATYHSAATARDRDRLRQAVLEGLGWRLSRVWSTDWWQDPASELQRLEAAIRQALLQPLPQSRPEPEPKLAEKPAEVVTAAPSVDAAPGNGEPQLPVYAAVTLAIEGDADAFYAPSNQTRIEAQCQQVLATEAPITFDLLCRRIAAAWNVARLTDRVREHVRAMLPTVAREHGGALWTEEQDPVTFAGFRTAAAGSALREADQLPDIEIGNAMAWLLSQHGALAKDDLLRETARLFGITRLGASVRAAMQHGMQQLASRRGCIIDGDIARLP